MVETNSSDIVLRLTAEIVAAHVEHNAVSAESLPRPIETVYQTLRTVGQVPTEPANRLPRSRPSSRSKPISSSAWRMARSSRRSAAA